MEDVRSTGLEMNISEKPFHGKAVSRESRFTERKRV
jgi:hypothetical protein